MSYSNEERFLTVQEVSEMLKISVLTIYKYIKDQKLEAIQLGGHYRIRQTALTSFLNRNLVGNHSEKDSR